MEELQAIACRSSIAIEAFRLMKKCAPQPPAKVRLHLRQAILELSVDKPAYLKVAATPA